MEAIYIPRLTRATHQTEVVDFQETIPGLETLTPVKGQLQVTHQGNYLEVSATAETIVTLTCHRCLQQYNYRLAIAPVELIWLEETPNHTDAALLDRDLVVEELVETLPPQGYFEPATWLYEQLCLEIPQRQLCEQTCKGIQLSSDLAPTPTVDRRWTAFEALKNQLSG